MLIARFLSSDEKYKVIHTKDISDQRQGDFPKGSEELLRYLLKPKAAAYTLSKKSTSATLKDRLYLNF
jgi:hypothetical protein